VEFSQLFGAVATPAATPASIALFLGLCLFGYLLGSISTAILVCRAIGAPDPRGEGSGNPGATNVMRVAGKGPALATLAGDVAKGVLPVIVARMLGIEGPELAWIGFFAFLGHLLPVFFRFEGGKGVATALGVINTLAWPAGLAVMMAWLIVFLPFRVSSLASIASWVLAPLFTWYYAPEYLAGVTLMAVLLIARHKQNIQDLLSGKERSFRGNK